MKSITIKVIGLKHKIFMKGCIEEGVTLNKKINELIIGYLEGKYSKKILGELKKEEKEDKKVNKKSIPLFKSTKSITVKIPDSLHKALKTECVNDDISIKSVVTALISTCYQYEF